MSSSEPCSARSKRRKVAATVEDFRLMLNDDSDFNFAPDAGCSPCSSNRFHADQQTTPVPKPADITDNIGSDLDCEPKSDVDDLMWSLADDQAFERELEACSNVCTEVECDIPDEGFDSSVISKEELGEWAVRHKIKHDALRDLLGIVRRQNQHLPKDPRTLLRTPREVSVKFIDGGSYYYLGVQNAISNIEKTVSCTNSNSWTDAHELSMQINIDGIPLFKSGNVTLWPILGRFPEISSSPFPIALFCGPSKPKSMDEFMQDFVSEMNEPCVKLLDKDVTVKLDAVICDAPARAMVKCCKAHMAYNSCERCYQKGIWRNKITFATEKARLRTDEDFKLQLDNAHHTGTSPLVSLPVGLVSQFPLDYMHVVCLGVVRRIILLWSIGPRTCRLSSTLLQAVSNRLNTYRSFMPRQFARKPRSLNEVRMWKATEFRTFLLYTGPVALKGLLSETLYNNFVCLSVAVTICLNTELCQEYANYCEKLFHYFVEQFAKLYGENQLVYNVHCLTHIVDDVRRYGCLDNVSAFPFENYLGHLKGMVRNAKKPCLSDC